MNDSSFKMCPLSSSSLVWQGSSYLLPLKTLNCNSEVFRSDNLFSVIVLGVQYFR